MLMQNGNRIDRCELATGLDFCRGVQSSRSQREGQLVIEDTVKGMQSRRYSYEEPYTVYLNDGT